MKGAPVALLTAAICFVRVFAALSHTCSSIFEMAEQVFFSSLFIHHILRMIVLARLTF